MSLISNHYQIHLFQLICLGPDLKEIAKKFTYAEVWGLAVSKDGLNAFNARNNDTTVSDLSEFISIMNDKAKFEITELYRLID